MKRMSWSLGSVLLLAFLAVTGCKPISISVPDVTGRLQAAASTAITGAGLTVGTITEEFSATIVSGVVMSQNPAAGTSVSPGSVVALTISKGPEPVTVPDVAGQTQAAASAVLTGAGLAVGTVTQEFSATVASGVVISQNPAAGTSVSPGSVVALTVSKGPQPVTVPDVVGETQASASTAIVGAGLAVGTVTQEFSATVASGVVISQNPAAGISVSPGTAVALTVSKGPQPVTVPDVVGETQAAASTAIMTVGLTVGTVTEQYSYEVPMGQVVSQTPAAGSYLEPGAAVDLVISKGPDPVILLPGNVPLELVRIPAGNFQMGAPETERKSESDEHPLHPVNIGRDFYLGKYEVTQKQWLAVMGSWPRTAPSAANGVGDDYPAYFISWSDAQNFISAVNAHITATGQGPATVRLPSEAEWEYASRAGTQTRFPFGDSLDVEDGCEDDGVRGQYMWYCGTTDQDGAHPVGAKLPNGFGLHDMSGNVYEWCEDWYHEDYSGAPADESAWLSPVPFLERVCRGGSWRSDAWPCRPANRSSGPPDSPNMPLVMYLLDGFRLARQ